VIDRLPLLGSGKLDHAAVTNLVRERFSQAAPLAMVS